MEIPPERSGQAGAPSLEQVFKGFAEIGFATATAYLLDDVELSEIVVDENLTHGFPGVVTSF